MFKKERRRERRVPGFGMTMSVGSWTVPVFDVSMSGCLVGSLDIPPGEILQAKLSLPLAVDNRTIDVMCSVISHSERGTGIRFVSNQYQSLMSIYMHLLRHDRQDQPTLE